MPDWAYRYRATQRVAADPVPKSQQLGARSAYSIEASGMQIRAFRLLRPVDLMWDVTRRDLASLRDRHLGLPGVQ